MTKIFDNYTTCAICGHESLQKEIVSTSMFGSCDLDGRPAPPHGENIEYFVQSCPKCGYAAYDIEEADDIEEKDKRIQRIQVIIKEDEFQRIRQDSSQPKRRNKFLRAAYITEKLGDLKAAGWHLLSAAWICDDLKKEASAKACRLNALQIFEQCKLKGIHICDPYIYEILTLADICRRAGQFEKALVYCNEVSPVETDERLIECLKYERSLCDLKTTERRACP